ncbi:MAG: MCP four helix bundle domain-containing protein [Bdellovibrionales bacterium]|nr:MCP four helix bundle domain-containing protein [Bdellovibrionales bacterium]
MRKWSIKKKLGILCLSLIGLVLVVGGIAVGANTVLMKQIRFVRETQVPAVRAMGVADMIHDGLRAVVLRAITINEDSGEKEKEEVIDELTEMTKNLEEQFLILSQLNINPEIEELVEQAKPDVLGYAKAAEKIIKIALSGQKQKALDQMNEFESAFKRLEVTLENLSEKMANGTQAERKISDRNQVIFSSIGIVVTILGLLFGAIVSILAIKDITNTLTRTIDQLESANSELNQAAEQTSSSAFQLNEAVTEQAASLQETMASIDEISSMVNQNSQSANHVKSAVDANQQASDEGSRSVGDMLNAIGEIKDTNETILSQMEESNNEFGEIVKIITEIGEKTLVINDIVFQTKLLSFNASVEAARAGEHGKGFAVVAEEVGNLAQMSGNAAKEIGDMLTGSIKQVNGIVEQTTQRVDQLMEVGRKKITLGQSTAERCREALNKIEDNASSVAKIVSEIIQASKEQAQGIQEINRAISQLDKVTQQNAEIAQVSSQQADQLKGNASNIATTVIDLVAFMGGDKYDKRRRGHSQKAKTIDLFKRSQEDYDPSSDNLGSKKRRA